jgi:hypothetical protein
MLAGPHKKSGLINRVFGYNGGYQKLKSTSKIFE